MPELEMGTQPIDAKMIELGLENHSLVAASTEQLTHKMVSKARRGRRLTINVKQKVLRAFNKAANLNCTFSDLFNY